MKLRELLDSISAAEKPGFLLDYNSWIPGPTYYPLPEQKYIDVTDDEADAQPREEQPPEEAKPEPVDISDKVDEGETSKKFKQISGGKQTVTASQAAQVAREAGFAPSESDTKNLQKETGDSLSYDQVKEFMSKAAHPEDNIDFLITFFKYFDQDAKGTLPKKAMANLLATFGEPLDAECISCVLKDEADPVNYRGFVQRITQR